LDGGRNITIIPQGPAVFGTEYHMSIKAADLAGNPAREVSWSFTMTDIGQVKGSIVGDGGRPLGGALVVLDDGSTYLCGDDGTFELGVRMGERTFYFTAEGHKRYRTTVVIDPIEDTDLGIIVLDRVGTKEESILERSLEDPMTLVLAALFIVLLVLGAINLISLLSDKGLFERRKEVRPDREVTKRFMDLGDEGRAKRGSRFRSGRR
jgi:hypothetical protein